MESVARILGFAGIPLHPADAPASLVGSGQILFCETSPCVEQFDYRFGELRAGRPRFVHAGAGQHVC